MIATAMPQPESPVRKLAQARVLAEIKEHLTRDDEMGVVYLAAWLEGGGKGWMGLAGLGDLADLDATELAQRVFQYGPKALQMKRRCWYCRHLEEMGDRLGCNLNRWVDREWLESYARLTVRHGRKFKACSDFERDEEVGDGTYGDDRGGSGR